jgi:HD-GYP domain-containing protein (c-di-GMP phosphodiesterase class II)
LTDSVKITLLAKSSSPGEFQELRNAYVGALEILAKYLESTDRYTRVHSVGVPALVAKMAIAIELPRTEVETILFRSRGLFFNF